MTRNRLAFLLVALALAAPAAAQEPAPPASAAAPDPVPAATAAARPAAPGAFGIGAKLGVVLPQVATELQTTVGAELELSYAVPVLGRRLAPFFGIGYAQPKIARSSLEDPRLPGSYDGTQTQRELTLAFGLLGRLMPLESRWNAYAGAGVRIYLLETVTVGSTGAAAFGENREQSTRVGGIFLVGGEFRLWRGSVLLELQYGHSRLPHWVTGEVTTGALTIALGYRLMLF
ncbi:MAG: hypothetical protein HY906_05985 [Deltaproteobacteria bacterium]|nr:hypothetical protein [Deltaproteobacteria bacterium]